MQRPPCSLQIPCRRFSRKFRLPLASRLPILKVTRPYTSNSFRPKSCVPAPLSRTGKEGPMLFRDRTDAGRQLAAKLRIYTGRPDVLVLALPRGGVPVAYEVAQALDAPLDVFLVRKLGLPGQEELAMGAVASGGVRVLNDEVVNGLAIPDWMIDDVARQEQQELRRREQLYRGNRPA